MVDWTAKDLLEEGEVGGPRPVRPWSCGVERRGRASLEHIFNKYEWSKRAHGRPNRSFFNSALGFPLKTPQGGRER